MKSRGAAWSRSVVALVLLVFALTPRASLAHTSADLVTGLDRSVAAVSAIDPSPVHALAPVGHGHDQGPRTVALLVDTITLGLVGWALLAAASRRRTRTAPAVVHRGRAPPARP